ncbi:MAG: methionyl-tRNA formyltransferase [Magnetovibrio sp.]|nr:methionyl-tRNA formyltransferase [Magnetovibrio sp.]
MTLRLAFMGSPDFAVPSLAALIDAGHEIACVFAQPPRPAGRGQKERRSPVHAFAAERGLEVRTPASFKDAAAVADFAALGLDAAVVAAYGLILPQRVLDAPRLGCFNVHASLLPRWRGAAPIQRAILAGDAETGVCIMGMEAGLDTGPVYAREAVPITVRTTAGELHDTLAERGARLIAETLPEIAAGRLAPVPQPVDGVTYADKLSRDEGRIDWCRPAVEIERMVRGLNPWPGVWFEHAGERIKVLAASLQGGENGAEVGTVTAPPLVVATGDGELAVERMQRPGKAALDADAFMRGYDAPIGTRLE